MEQTAVVEYILPPFLTRGGIMLMAAPNKSMKTFLGLHMATAIASGKPFIDMPTEQARVLYIDYEIGIAEAKKRYTPMQKHYGVTDDFLIRTSDEMSISLDPGTVGTANLFSLLDDVRPKVVFIDTLRMAHSGEESSSTDMARAFNRLRDLKIRFNFSAVVVHHMGKEPDERNTSPRTSRGSSVIEDFPDTIGHITKHVTGDNEPGKMSIKWKFRNHSPIPNSRFTFDPATGMFMRTVAAQKEKKEDDESTEVSSDLSDGLLSAV